MHSALGAGWLRGTINHKATADQFNILKGQENSNCNGSEGKPESRPPVPQSCPTLSVEVLPKGQQVIVISPASKESDASIWLFLCAS